jgi:hypothetical protein
MQNGHGQADDEVRAQERDRIDDRIVKRTQEVIENQQDVIEEGGMPDDPEGFLEKVIDDAEDAVVEAVAKAVLVTEIVYIPDPAQDKMMHHDVTKSASVLAEIIAFARSGLHDGDVYKDMETLEEELGPFEQE